LAAVLICLPLGVALLWTLPGFGWALSAGHPPPPLPPPPPPPNAGGGLWGRAGASRLARAHRRRARAEASRRVYRRALARRARRGVHRRCRPARSLDWRRRG